MLYHQQTNVAQLYLPLLTHPQPAVRRQACLILLGTYGDRALTYLRRLIDDADPQVRQAARLALLAVAEVSEEGIILQPFKGMQIECLGRLRVYIGNHEMRAEDWAQAEGGRAGQQKVQGALAYLVHCGRRGVSRAALGAALWGTACSASSLSRTLSTLRQAIDRHAEGVPGLAGALVVEPDYCLLDPNCYHTDVQLFERAFDMATQTEQDQGLAAAAPLYTHAVELYGGPYMADLPRGARWCRQRREHVLGSFVIAAERLAEHAYAQLQYRNCIDICAMALDADPTADDVVAWLMRAYAALGQYAEFEHAYRGYLRVIGLTPESVQARHDPVVRLYRDVGRAGI